VLGLQAQACGRSREAAAWLAAASAEPGGVLEDWRLLTLAEALSASGQGASARAELGRLLADHPASPLHARALSRVAELAWQDHDLAAATAAIEQARRDGIAGPESLPTRNLAWEIGRQASQPSSPAPRRAGYWSRSRSSLEDGRHQRHLADARHLLVVDLSEHAGAGSPRHPALRGRALQRRRAEPRRRAGGRARGGLVRCSALAY
jgi:hypothetical protein